MTAMPADRSPKPRRRSSGSAGFSLIELAVVLMIVGTLMSGVLVAVSQSMANARITDARAQLREIEEALYGYAQATGRLPCPATVVSAGQADPVGGGVCAQWHGFVPATTLALAGPVNSDGLLVDPWRNPIRYSVTSFNHSMASPSFTTVSSETTGIKELFNNIDADNNGEPDFYNDPVMLRVCEAPGCGGTIYADAAPAVVLSMGANWANFTSADETKNAGSATVSGNETYAVKDESDVTANDFVSTTYSEDNFDDQLVWLSPYILFNRMVSAGKLP